MDCIRCGKEVTSDGAGLNRKLISRGCTQFLCIDCLAVKFDVTAELLKEKAEQFRKSGCMLFVRKDNEDE